MRLLPTLVLSTARCTPSFAATQEEVTRTYADIAAEDGVPAYRVQQAICYAFLAPDIVRQVLQGRQPVGLTSKYIFRHSLPIDWAEQRALIATL